MWPSEENTIRSLDDVLEHARIHRDLSFCWFGPRISDVTDLAEAFPLAGAIGCYGAVCAKTLPTLSYERASKRERVSVDDLVDKLDSHHSLPNFLRAHGINKIVPYDSSPALEAQCQESSIHLLSSPEHVKNALRDKTWIDHISLAVGLPVIPGVTGCIDDLEFEPLSRALGLPLFLQFAEGSGGSGNRIVRTREEFESVKKLQFGKRLNAKRFFAGRSYTIDICVAPHGTICGPLEEMLIGASPLNTNPTEYVASSWFANGYDEAFRAGIRDIGLRLGNLARRRGFLGCFHPDFLIGEDGQVFLTELNMRFGGSCGAISRIHVRERRIPFVVLQALVFSSHTLALDIDAINEENLRPLDYCHMVFKNNFGGSITVPARLSSGWYDDGDAGLKRSAVQGWGQSPSQVRLTNLPDTGENTVVSSGAPICEAMVRYPISNSRSELNAAGSRLARIIRSMIEA